MDDYHFLFLGKKNKNKKLAKVIVSVVLRARLKVILENFFNIFNA